MSRRVEAQLDRDWTFGFISWNYIFRPIIIHSRTFFAYQGKNDAQQCSGVQSKDVASARKSDAVRTDYRPASANNSGRGSENSVQTMSTPDTFKDGANQLCGALWGKCRDLDGNMQSVTGDMTKLRYVAGSSVAAKKLLQNIERTGRCVFAMVCPLSSHSRQTRRTTS